MSGTILRGAIYFSFLCLIMQSQTDITPGNFILPILSLKKFYTFLTNTGHCCMYSGVVQYNFSAPQTWLFGFYAMLFMSEKK